MTTNVFYDDIELRNCQTLEFDEEIVRDSSGVQVIGHRFRMTFQGYCFSTESSSQSMGNLQRKTFETPPLPPVTAYVKAEPEAVDEHKVIRRKLLEPRKRLQVFMGARAIVTADGAGIANEFDLSQGPHPSNLKIQHVAGQKTLKITWTVECLVAECNFEESKNSPVVSNRWTCIDSVDNNMYLTRSWDGELRFAHPTLNPNDFRTWCLPPVTEGFRRQSMKFTATADGLMLRYSIQDIESTFAAPGDATGFTFEQKDHVGDDGVTMKSAFSCRLSCDRSANKRRLIQIAAALVDSRLMIEQLIGRAQQIRILSYDVVDASGNGQKNEVMVAAVVQRLFSKTRVENATARMGMPIEQADFDRATLLYDANRNRGGGRPHLAADAPEVSGPIKSTWALSTYLQSRCGEELALCSELNGMGIKSVPDNAFNVEPCVVDAQIVNRVDVEDVEVKKDWLSDEHRDNIYTHSRVESTYEQDQLVVASPIAGEPEEPTGSGSGGDPGGTEYDVVSPTPRADDHTAFIRLGREQTFRVVKVVAERVGTEPVFPAHAKEFTDISGNVNVLLMRRVKKEAPIPEIGGAGVFRARLELTFGVAGQLTGYRSGAHEHENAGSTSGPIREQSEAQLFSGWDLVQV